MTILKTAARETKLLLNGLQHSKDLLNSHQDRSKNNLVSDNAVTRVHGICSLRVMVSFPGILFPSSFNYLFSEKPFVLLISLLLCPFV